MVNKNIDLKFRPKGNKNFSFFITIMHIFSHIQQKNGRLRGQSVASCF
jgi:hypothetical protein